MITRWVLAFVIAACGCTEQVQLDHADAGGLPGLISLQVSPPATTLAIADLSQPPQTVAYTATGTFADGGTRDVTAQVAWSTDNDGPGSFVMAGSYRTSNAAAGHVGVIATSGSITGTAALTVTVALTIVDDVFPPPSGAEDAFGSDVPTVVADPMRSPAIAYPANATMFPQGLAPIVIQYATGMANDAFRLAFDSDVLHLVVFSGGDRWAPDATIWNLIAKSTAAASVNLAVDAVDTTMPTAIYTNPPETLQFATAEPAGAIDYFSTSTNGVMQGLLAAISASKLYPPTADTTCVGCHTISRTGNAMAFGYGGPTLGTVALPSLTPQIAPTNLPMGWAAWSPAGDHLLVAARGVLTLYDATGAGTAVAMPMLATHPDWSPDGTAVVVSLPMTIDPMDMDVKGGSIAILPFVNKAFGPPKMLVMAGPMDNNFFPRWSPDGHLIAFVHATSSSHDAQTSELRVVDASGGTPVPLRIASHRLGSTDDVMNLDDTMPAWIPAPGAIQWLAFASTRPYGVVRPAMMGTSQIWLAGIDITQGAATDASFAAFWLPCQDITVVNNTPVWAASTSDGASR